MKMSIWQSVGDYSVSVDFEFDANSKAEVTEVGKYSALMGVIKNEETTMEDIKELVRSHILNVSSTKG